MVALLQQRTIVPSVTRRQGSSTAAHPKGDPAPGALHLDSCVTRVCCWCQQCGGRAAGGYVMLITLFIVLLYTLMLVVIPARIRRERRQYWRARSAAFGVHRPSWRERARRQRTY